VEQQLVAVYNGQIVAARIDVHIDFALLLRSAKLPQRGY